MTWLHYFPLLILGAPLLALIVFAVWVQYSIEKSQVARRASPTNPTNPTETHDEL